jgi:hypothetical protein
MCEIQEPEEANLALEVAVEVAVALKLQLH